MADEYIPMEFYTDEVLAADLEFGGGADNGLKLGAGTKSLYQESEKDDKAVTLKFADIPNVAGIKDANGNPIARTYNRIEESNTTSVALGSSVASGKRAFASGSSNVASGSSAVAMGSDNYVSGNQGFAGGYANAVLTSGGSALGSANVVKKPNGHAHGSYNVVEDNDATAQGCGLIANTWGGTVIGTYNDPNVSNHIFMIGNGVGDTARSNAFIVYRDGRTSIGADPIYGTDVATKQYVDNKASGGATPARYIAEIKTEPLINFNGGTGGTWTEYIYNDGTVEAEALVKNMYFSKYGGYNESAFYYGAYGTNCFNDPTKFTLKECWVEIYNCSKTAIIPRTVYNNCAMYPMLNVFKDSNTSTLPDSVTCSYVIKAKGTA